MCRHKTIAPHCEAFLVFVRRAGLAPAKVIDRVIYSHVRLLLRHRRVKRLYRLLCLGFIGLISRKNLCTSGTLVRYTLSALTADGVYPNLLSMLCKETRSGMERLVRDI